MALNGMLLYGFAENDAEKVKVLTDTTLGGDVIVLTASEKEDEVVDDRGRGFAFGLFHDLADEEGHGFGAARFVIGNRLGLQ